MIKQDLEINGKAIVLYSYIMYKNQNRSSEFIKNILLFLIEQKFVCVTKHASISQTSNIMCILPTLHTLTGSKWW